MIKKFINVFLVFINYQQLSGVSPEEISYYNIMILDQFGETSTQSYELFVDDVLTQCALNLLEPDLNNRRNFYLFSNSNGFYHLYLCTSPNRNHTHILGQLRIKPGQKTFYLNISHCARPIIDYYLESIKEGEDYLRVSQEFIDTLSQGSIFFDITSITLRN